MVWARPNPWKVACPMRRIANATSRISFSRGSRVPGFRLGIKRRTGRYVRIVKSRSPVRVGLAEFRDDEAVADIEFGQGQHRGVAAVPGAIGEIAREPSDTVGNEPTVEQGEG